MSDMEDFVDDVGGMNAVRRDLNQLLGRLREHVPVPQGGPRAFQPHSAKLTLNHLPHAVIMVFAFS